jgi:hypothetical protein
MSLPKLFIGIPCYQESDSLKQTLAFLEARTTGPHSVEVQIAKKSVVENKNALLAKARRSDAEFICLCDDDVEPELGYDKSLIEGIVRARKRGISVGQTSPRLLFPDGTICCIWINVLLNANSADKRIVNCPGAGSDDLSLYHVQMLVGALPGTLTIFSREFLEKTDWQFDVRYEKSQYEDLDQSLVCRDLGFKLLYNGCVGVVHHTRKFNPRASEENLLRFFAKWASRSDLSMAIETTPESMAQGVVPLANLSGRHWCRMLPILLKNLAGNPIDRVQTGFRILHRQGFRGFFAALKMMSGGHESPTA